MSRRPTLILLTLALLAGPMTAEVPSSEDQIRAAVSPAPEEIAAGKLSFPSGPAALCSLTGPTGSFDAGSQTVRGGSRAYAIYLSYATAEATGLPTSAITETGPWLMAAGEPWAHIMVVQPTAEAPEKASD